VISTFPAIPTALDGVQIVDGLPEIAKVLDRATLIRSHVQADLGAILHSRHQFHWHTGYVPPQTVACPHLGAWMSRVLGPRNPVMPAFVNVGQRLEGIGENEEIKAFTTAGFFGSESALIRRLSSNGLERRSHPLDALVRRLLLTILTEIYRKHQEPKQLVKLHHLSALLKGIIDQDKAVLVRQVASELFESFKLHDIL
jgi:hypothetical protein